MTHDTAMLVSSALAGEGIAHVVEVQSAARARVDVLGGPRLVAAIDDVEAIAEQFGARLALSVDPHGPYMAPHVAAGRMLSLTFVDAKAGATRVAWPSSIHRLREASR